MQYFFRGCMIALLLTLPASMQAQIYGCTDPTANNYNAAANRNDGSCTYATLSLTPNLLGVLSDSIKETSGLVFWNGYLWTHNDDTDTMLYAIDTMDGHIVKRIAVVGAPNHDWEEVTQDNDYLYIGDFGNNADGNRRNLLILRIAKAQILAGAITVTPDKINFSYADQTNFAATGSNNSDFDCEAFIATNDSLYLFNKQYVSGKSKIYTLPKVPGTYMATPKAEYNVDGLVTGATYNAAKKTVVLCGYKKSSALYQPFVYLLYDYSGYNFFSGNKREILINPLLFQTEGIATIDGKRFFISNEKHSPNNQSLRSIDLSTYLNTYYTSLSAATITRAAAPVSFYPNPATNNFSGTINAVKDGQLQANIYNALGQQLENRIIDIHAGANEINFHQNTAFAPGIYWVKLVWEGKLAWGKVCID